MSQTRILCEKCGFPQAFCACDRVAKPEGPEEPTNLAPASESHAASMGAVPVSPLDAHYPLTPIGGAGQPGATTEHSALLPSPASQPLALALAAAAREITACHWKTGTGTAALYAAILHRHVAPVVEQVMRELERVDNLRVSAEKYASEFRADLARRQAELDSAKQRAQDWQLSYASNNQQRAVVEEELRQRLARTQAALDEAKNNLEGARRVNARLTQVDFRNADIIDKLQEDRDLARREAMEWRGRAADLSRVAAKGVYYTTDEAAAIFKERDDLRTQLTAQRSAADDDRERLDWISEMDAMPEWDDNGFWKVRFGGRWHTGNTVRAAIDAARASERRENA